MSDPFHWRVHATMPRSRANGPGNRFVIWLRISLLETLEATTGTRIVGYANGQAGPVYKITTPDDNYITYQGVDFVLQGRPTPKLDVGLELRLAEREIESGASGQMRRLQAVAKYSFSGDRKIAKVRPSWSNRITSSSSTSSALQAATHVPVPADTSLMSSSRSHDNGLGLPGN
jgi:hypothetical protein